MCITIQRLATNTWMSVATQRNHDGMQMTVFYYKFCMLEKLASSRSLERGAKEGGSGFLLSQMLRVADPLVKKTSAPLVRKY